MRFFIIIVISLLILNFTFPTIINAEREPSAFQCLNVLNYCLRSCEDVYADFPWLQTWCKSGCYLAFYNCYLQSIPEEPGA